MKRWVATEPGTLGAVLAALGLDASGARAALDDGRVFVGRTRALDIEMRIAKGAEILVHPARDAIALPEPFVLHRGRGMLAVDKPVGLPTIPDLEGSAGTLIDLAARAIGRSRDTLQPTSRLDRDVSGVVTFALDEVARARWEAARAAGRHRRVYLAIAPSALALAPGLARATWRWSIDRDPRDPRRRRAVDPGGGSGKVAESRVAVVRVAGPWALYALAPQTGRTHQLRVHAAAAGIPLLGDGAYGGVTRLTTSTGAVRTFRRIALHCAAVDVQLDARSDGDAAGEKISVRSPVPPELAAMLATLGLDALGGLGGATDPIEEALRCEPWRVDGAGPG